MHRERGVTPHGAPWPLFVCLVAIIATQVVSAQNATNVTSPTSVTTTTAPTTTTTPAPPTTTAAPPTPEPSFDAQIPPWLHGSNRSELTATYWRAYLNAELQNVNASANMIFVSEAAAAALRAPDGPQESDVETIVGLAEQACMLVAQATCVGYGSFLLPAVMDLLEGAAARGTTISGDLGARAMGVVALLLATGDEALATTAVDVTALAMATVTTNGASALFNLANVVGNFFSTKATGFNTVIDRARMTIAGTRLSSAAMNSVTFTAGANLTVGTPVTLSSNSGLSSVGGAVTLAVATLHHHASAPFAASPAVVSEFFDVGLHTQFGSGVYELTDPITLDVTLGAPVAGRALECRYFDTFGNTWSTEGVDTELPGDADATTIRCTTTHLSFFAVFDTAITTTLPPTTTTTTTTTTMAPIIPTPPSPQTTAPSLTPTTTTASSSTAPTPQPVMTLPPVNLTFPAGPTNFTGAPGPDGNWTGNWTLPQLNMTNFTGFPTMPPLTTASSVVTAPTTTTGPAPTRGDFVAPALTTEPPTNAKADGAESDDGAPAGVVVAFVVILLLTVGIGVCVSLVTWYRRTANPTTASSPTAAGAIPGVQGDTGGAGAPDRSSRYAVGGGEELSTAKGDAAAENDGDDYDEVSVRDGDDDDDVFDQV